MGVLATTFAVALVLYGLGSWIEHLAAREPDDSLDAAAYRLFAGWALASLVGVGVALAGRHLAVPVLIVGIAGASGLLLQRQSFNSLGALLAAWVLVLPLMWIAAHTGPTMFDEFTHWLPNARFLIENDAFPDAGHQNVWSAQPGYPPALGLIGYAAQRLGGSGFETAPKIFNLMVAGAFGLVLADLLQGRLGRWLAIATGVAAATLLNPFFDSRTALTVHPDAASGFVLAVGLTACWRAVADGDARAWWRIAALGVLLVLLRETGIVLAAGLGLGLLLLGRRAKPVLVVHAASCLAAFALWRLYLVIAAQPSALAVRRFADWDWGAPWAVLHALITERVANHPLLGAAAGLVLAVVMVLLVLRVRGARAAVRDLVVLCVAVAVTWLAFVAWTYTAVFSPDEIANAKSAWRYLSELGPSLIVLCVALIAAPLSASRVPAARLRWAGALVCVLVPAGLLSTWRHWRLDCTYPDVRVVRELAHALGPMIRDDPAGVVHPTDASGYDHMIDYELHRRFGASLGVAQAEQVSQDWLIDVSGIARDALLNGRTPPAVTVMRRTGNGWTSVQTIPPGPRHVCGFADDGPD